MVIQQIIEQYLRRIEHDLHGMPVRFYPFTRNADDAVNVPRLIVMDPFVAFGRPVVQNTRVTTSIILERWSAGDDIKLLADDYKLSSEAIRCETRRRAT